jgi:hypothetical protein
VTTFEVDELMEQPIYFYYQIEGFYQNHRRYFRSRSDDQLGGDEMSVGELGECEPVVTNADLGFEYAADGKSRLDP